MPERDLSRCNIIVTGGAGFFGRAIVRALQARGVANERIFVPRSRDFDLTRADHTRRMYETALGGGTDIVIHAAGYVGGIAANVAEPARFFHDNMQMGLNVIEQARQTGLIERDGKIVLIGTASSYPEHAVVPFRESDLWSGYPHPSGAPYGLAKAMTGAMLAMYRAQHGLNGAYLVPINLYGPGDHFDEPSRAHVVASLIARSMHAVRSGEQVVTCWGSGTPTRDFLYVDDAAEAVCRAAERIDDPQPINIGTGVETPIRVLAEAIARATGFAGRVDWDASKPDGHARRALDTRRATDVLGWRAATSLDEGLAKTVAWLRAQADKAPGSG